MSNYNFPTTGGLKTTFNSVQYGVWVDESPIGPILIAARYDAQNGWLAFYNWGPDLNTAFQAEIDKVGSIIAWLKSLLPAINAAFARVTGGTPVTPPADGKIFTVAGVNAALASAFQLNVSSSGITITAK